ncbi:TATE DNA Transposon [Trypanosoma theileri]|uniref:TATE DNA Transposon n=1 Tax=Trypanosoma theileri TaxID=67003 RepID=A0A1X0P2J9_9TRYP|nr:TATE DNA Transposon [Trypanosoma theileri]ORC91166.1 TATE DNA Transposon [Trypanosoma theileri]
MTEKTCPSTERIAEEKVLSIREMAQEGFTGGQLDAFLRNLQRACDRNDTQLLDRLMDKALEASLAKAEGNTTSDDKAKQTENNNTAGYLAQQQEHALSPWKRMQTMAKNFWRKLTDSYCKNESSEAAKKCFIELAEIGRLTPTEVMIGQYLFFAEDPAYALECLKTLLFNCEEEYRVQFHNWGLVESFDPVKQEMYGARVEKLQYPLFPDIPEFRKLNAELLRPTKGTLHGGSSDATPEAEKLYDLKREGVLSGGGYTEAIYDAHGQQIAAMDMSNTEQHLALLATMVKDLQRKQRHHTSTPTPAIHTNGGGRRGRGGAGAGVNKGRGVTFATSRPYQYRGGGESADCEFDEPNPKNVHPPSERKQQ